MTNSLEGHTLLRIADKAEDLDFLRKMLSARFDRTANKTASALAQPT